jgi:hypothetical protein
MGADEPGEKILLASSREAFEPMPAESARADIRPSPSPPLLNPVSLVAGASLAFPARPQTPSRWSWEHPCAARASFAALELRFHRSATHVVDWLA